MLVCIDDEDEQTVDTEDVPELVAKIFNTLQADRNTGAIRAIKRISELNRDARMPNAHAERLNEALDDAYERLEDELA